MIMDVVQVMDKDYDHRYFSIQLIDCFDDLVGRDANFEIVASQTLQPVKLHFSHNVVTESIAVIFLNTNLKGLKYGGGPERASMLENLFKEVLEFDTVKVHTDLKKEQIREVLESLKKRADDFEATKGEKDILTIAISNVGFNLRPMAFK